MPKISAPTVAEHRERRLRTLLHAGRDLVSEQGPEALTLGSLAQRVGLSRSSVYEYFRSRDDLAAAIIEDALPRWAEETEQELARHDGLSAKVAGYVKHQIWMLTDGQHAAAVALSSHALGDEIRDRIRQEHERLLAPLVQTLADAGIPDAELRAQFIQGIVNAAAARLDTSEDAQDSPVARAAADQAMNGLTTASD